MSWDIYGNPLRRGHCEVHPHVHEEYPCSVCMSERGQVQQPHDALQQLQYEFAQQGDYIKQLQAERDALAAQVEVLKDSINKCTVDGVALLRLSSELKQAVAATPRQHLAEIRAEAGRAAIYALFEVGNCPQYENGAGDGFIECGDALKFADQYAAKVRQGGE